MLRSIPSAPSGRKPWTDSTVSPTLAMRCIQWIPPFYSIYDRIDMRTRTDVFDSGEVQNFSLDQVPLKVNAVVYFRIIDPGSMLQPPKDRRRSPSRKIDVRRDARRQDTRQIL